MESNLGTAIRTCVVLVMAWMMVWIQGMQKEVRAIPHRELLFICLSGAATGASWLCYYRALQEGPASIVAPIDKLSVLVTAAFSYFVFGEKLSRRALAGLLLLTAGTVAWHSCKEQTIKRRSLFHRDQVADVRALSGEHIVIEPLLPVNVVHTALQLLDGGEEGFSFLHKQELEKWKKYGQQTDF